MIELENKFKKSINLDGKWELSCSEKDIYRISAIVPGSVYEDLLNVGIIDDPFYRDNEKNTQWIGESDWDYRRVFYVENDFIEMQEIELEFDGLDTVAVIALNGKELGKTYNMHRKYSFSVKKLLKAGKNILDIRFISAIKYIKKLQNIRKMPEWIDADKSTGYGQIRKMASNFGWDIAPKLVTCGIWRSVCLVGSSSSSIDNLNIRQKHKVDGMVELIFLLTIKRMDNLPIKGYFEIFDSKQDICNKGYFDCGKRDNKVEIKTKINFPELWWPNGMGEQKLYNISFKLLNNDDDLLDFIEKKIGLRSIRLIRENDDFGESFYFSVNNKPFFVKGTNWSPTTPYGTCQDEKHYRKLLESAKFANMNMVRVWGGGIYEEDMFYTICDELGLCVWQDFMYACSGYPLDDADFLENITIEARENVRRLHHHPCIALWNGNNELELGWSAGWGLVGDYFKGGSFGHIDFNSYSSFFDKILANIIKEENQDCAYWPASPHSPIGDRKDSNNDKCGDAHIWNVMMEGEPFSYYRMCNNRFISEFGYQSIQDASVLDKYLLPKDKNITSRVIDYHQRQAQLGTPVIIKHMSEHFRMPKNFEMTCILTQILQGLLIKIATEHWRGNMPQTMGVLHWKLNDMWPGFTGSTIDFKGNKKASYYIQKATYSPALISGIYNKKDNSVDIFLTFDYVKYSSGIFSWYLVNLDGETIKAGSEKIIIKVNSSEKLYTLNFDLELNKYNRENLMLFLELSTDKGERLSNNTIPFCPYKHLELKDPELMWEVVLSKENYHIIKITAKKPAIWCWASNYKKVLDASNNFFHLRSNESKEITIVNLNYRDLNNLEINSLYNTYI